MAIYMHNLRSMLSGKKLLIYFGIFIVAFFYLATTFNSMLEIDKPSTMNALINKYIASFFMIMYIWSLGMPFLISIIGRGTSIIQQEIEDETIVLMLSKPTTRSKIFFEKWLSSITATAIISVLSIFLSISLYIIAFNVDTIVLQTYLSFIPSLIIYGLLINIIYNSISIIMTSLLNHRIVSVIILLILVMLLQLVFPLFKPTIDSAGLYTKFKLFFYDTNYQFGILYYILITAFSLVEFTPFAQTKIAQYIGIFNLRQDHPVDPELGFAQVDISPLNFLNPLLVFILWFVAAIVFLFISHFLFKKRDFT